MAKSLKYAWMIGKEPAGFAARYRQGWLVG
jgi:hypothetical protein